MFPQKLLIENCNYTGVFVVKIQHFASLLRKNDSRRLELEQASTKAQVSEAR